MDSILTPLQQAVLQGVFAKGLGGLGFFLSGGSALAEFYLHHRDSDDLDLFTRTPQAIDAGVGILRAFCNEAGYDLDEDHGDTNFRCLFVSTAGHSSRLKVDLVHEWPPEIEPPKTYGDVRVDSLVDIAVNKVLCLYDRNEVKDFVDVYCLVPERFTLDSLLTLVPNKQGGFENIQFAAQLRHVEDLGYQFSRLRLRRPLEFTIIRDFFLARSRELMDRFGQSLSS